MFSFRGKKVGPLPDLSPLRVNSKFPTSILTPFIWESLRGGLPRYFIVLAPGSNSTNKFKLSFFQAFRWRGTNVWNWRTCIYLLPELDLWYVCSNMFCLLRPFLFVLGVKTLDDWKSNQKQWTSLVKRNSRRFRFFFYYLQHMQPIKVFILDCCLLSFPFYVFPSFWCFRFVICFFSYRCCQWMFIEL